MKELLVDPFNTSAAKYPKLLLCHMGQWWWRCSPTGCLYACTVTYKWQLVRKPLSCSPAPSEFKRKFKRSSWMPSLARFTIPSMSGCCMRILRPSLRTWTCPSRAAAAWTHWANWLWTPTCWHSWRKRYWRSFARTFPFPTLSSHAKDVDLGFFFSCTQRYVLHALDGTSLVKDDHKKLNTLVHYKQIPEGALWLWASLTRRITQSERLGQWEVFLFGAAHRWAGGAQELTLAEPSYESASWDLPDMPAVHQRNAAEVFGWPVQGHPEHLWDKPPLAIKHFGDFLEEQS